MRVIIAEKPSLARAIMAGFPGGEVRHQGYSQVATDTLVTWCYGHLYELAAPEAYDAKWIKWDLATLPIVIAPNQWRLVPRKDRSGTPPIVAPQIATIAKLLQQADEVINAGDPDREGQMLVDEILEMLHWKGPTKRLLLHDTTPASVKKALTRLQPNTDFAPLYAAAKCRSRADWLVGMNLSRAVSKKTGVTISIGRVQTPTLALVVRRDLAIEGHAASAFYKLAVKASTARDTVVLTHDPAPVSDAKREECEKNGLPVPPGRITDKAEAVRIANALKGATVTLSVEEKAITENAPRPFRLPTFQEAAEKRYKWTATKALAALQSAYEKQLVSYPRTDCDYMPEEQASRAQPIARKIISTVKGFADLADVVELMQPNPATYDDAKVEQHHGLAPTSLPTASTDPDAVKAWQLVTEQFLKSLLPAYTATVKMVWFTFEERVFSASGEQPNAPEKTWRRMEPKRKDGKPVPTLNITLEAGQEAPARVGEVKVSEGKTTPPKPYTEATLIKDMGSVHKFVDDPRIKKILKENSGIGTAATQAAILETLKARKFLALVKGEKGAMYLKSTVLGRYVVQTVPPPLCDPGITALWEDTLGKVAKGAYDPASYMQQIDAFVRAQLNAVVATRFPPAPQQASTTGHRR